MLLAFRGDAGQGTRIGRATDDDSHVKLVRHEFVQRRRPGKLLVAGGAQDGFRDLVGVDADGGVAARLQHGSDDFLQRAAGR